ncbi:hypothetical protein [Methylobacterium sp. WL7]|uniref:hypothetical protein n=1 Tax=Methylobacterium sp. WL7 TaxID=2603900 RepID=UPI0016502C6F
MPSLDVAFTPTDRPDPIPSTLEPESTFAPEDVARAERAEPPRVIEIGEITAGIAVPEGRGVRFFSSARDFDGLDGAVFRNAEQAARAARERVAARTRSAARGGQTAAEIRRRRA